MKTLVLVYELQTDDHIWLESFYPVFRFREESEKQGFSFVALLEQELKPWLEIQKEKDSLFKETIFFLRGRISKDTYSLLKENKAIFVNSSKSATLATDKLKTAAFCKKNNIHHPITFGLRDYKKLFSPVSSSEISSVIVKPRFGSRGRNIQLFKTQQEIYNFFLKNKDEADNWIIQQYIDGKRGTDLRFLICNQKILGAFERKSDNLCSNSCQGSTCKKTQVTKDIEDIALKVARGTDLFFCSVDFIFSKAGTAVLCEINQSPGFEATEKETSENIAEKVIAEIKELMQKNQL